MAGKYPIAKTATKDANALREEEMLLFEDDPALLPYGIQRPMPNNELGKSEFLTLWDAVYKEFDVAWNQWKAKQCI